MGTVLLARLAGAGGFQRLFAVKLLHKFYADDSEFVEMLLDEARIAARIHHPNVVSIQEVEQSREHGYYLVMDYVEGFTLWDLSNALQQAPWRQRARMVIRIVLDSLNGLEAAHTLLDDEGRPLGVVHRDVSPQNILVAVNGIARVTDFGIAKAATRMTTTRVGQVKGKLAYMAPEQAKGLSLDTRADVWAVAVVLWESLTGRRLFKGTNDSDTYRRVLNAPVPRLNEMFSEAPAALSDLILRALERDVNRRVASAREFSQALESVARAHSLLADPHEISAWIRERFAAELALRRDAIKDAAAGDATAGNFSSLPGGISVPQLPEKSLSRAAPTEGVATADVSVDSLMAIDDEEPASVTKREGGLTPPPAPLPRLDNDEPSSITRKSDDHAPPARPLVPRPVAANPAEFDEVFNTVVVDDNEPATQATAPSEDLIAAARAARGLTDDDFEAEEFDDQATARMDTENMSPGVKAAIMTARQLFGSRGKPAAGVNAAPVKPPVEEDDNNTTQQGRNPLARPRPIGGQSAAAAPALSPARPTPTPAPASGPVPTAFAATLSANAVAPPVMQAQPQFAPQQFAQPVAMPNAPPMPQPAMHVQPPAMHAPMPSPFGDVAPGYPPVDHYASASRADSSRQGAWLWLVGALLLAALGAGLGYFFWKRQMLAANAPGTPMSATPFSGSVAPSNVSPTTVPSTAGTPSGTAAAANTAPQPAANAATPTAPTPTTNVGNAADPTATAAASAPETAPRRGRATRSNRVIRRAPVRRAPIRLTPVRRRGSQGLMDTPPI